MSTGHQSLSAIAPIFGSSRPQHWPRSGLLLGQGFALRIFSFPPIPMSEIPLHSSIGCQVHKYPHPLLCLRHNADICVEI